MIRYHIKNQILVLAFSLITLNLFPQTFIEKTGILLPGVNNSSVAWGDYDNDGFLDILITGYSSTGQDISKIFHNNSGSSFTEQTGIALTGVSGGSAAWGDYDNDGYLDILLTGSSNSSPISKIYHNNGNNTFSEQTTINLTAVRYGSVAWGDYDNDGYLDILLTGYSVDGYVSKIYRNNGNNTFTEQKGISLTGLSSGSAAWGDYDNDGYLDILLTGEYYDETYHYVAKIYRNNGDNTFTEKTNTSLTGIYSGSVAWGDYDNDGNLDILLTGSGISKIYRNDNGVFSDINAGLLGVTNSSAAWGDYDNDGDLDILITGHWNGGNISKIYRNNGSNIFIEQTDISLTGVTSGSVAWGDYDRDGKLDILITGYDENYNAISKIYRNNYSTANIAPSAPSGLTAICTDTSVVLRWDRVQGDATPSLGIGYNVRVGTSSGASDVVSPMVKPSSGTRLKPGLGNTQENNFYILRYPKKIQYFWSVQAIDNGFASSSFAVEIPPITFSSSVQASQIFADIIQGSSLTLHWQRGNGSGCSVFAKEGNSGMAAPVNGNSYPANAQFGNTSSEIGTTGWYCVYNGTGNSVDITGLKGLTNYIFQVIEFDASTVYFTRKGTANPYVFQTSVFTEQTGISLPGYSRGSAAWGNYGSDNYLDILLTGYGGGNSAIYKNNGNNTFSEQSDINNLPAIYNGSVAWGDYDNDGDLDLLFTGSGVSSIYRNNGDNTFSEQTGTNLIGVSYSSAAWCDFDNDGDLDIIIAGSSSSSGIITKIYRNNGNLTFTEQPGINLPGISEGSIACGDYDNDGYIDILLTGNNLSKIYRNNGDFTFTEQTGISLPDVRYSSAAWGDYDNDGYLDILLTGSTSSDRISKIYRNNGNNSFTEQTQISLKGVQYSSVAWGDYDNDGDLDILITGESYDGTISKIYHNNGNNTFSEQTKINLTGVKYSSVAWSDYDNDGDLDILLTGEKSGNSAISKIYRNDILTKNVPPAAPQGLSIVKNIDNVILSWNPVASDETPSKGLSYNIRVGTSSGGNQTKAAMASSVSGLRNMPAMGNCQHNTSYVLKNLLPGTYYWSVQAIDNNFAGGAFGTENIFTVESIQASKLEAKILSSSNSSLIIKWKKGNGQRRVVFCKQVSTGSANPDDNTTYTPDPVFGYGDQIGTSGWYSIYNGRGDSAIVDGLTSGVAYSFHVIEYTGSTGSEVYYRTTGDANPGIFSSGLFSLQSDINIWGVDGSSVAWGDYNNNGYLDFLLTGDGISKIFRNNGDNTFTSQDGISLEGVSFSSVAWGDYDNDGNLDILLTGYSNSSSSVISKIYHNNYPLNTFTEQTGISLAGITHGSATWGDYDNDGYLDILLTGMGNPYPYGRVSKIYHNNGNKSFTEQTDISLTPVKMSSAAWGDFDNDGYLDILLTGWAYEGPVSKIYHNNGDNTFTELTDISLAGVTESSVALGDYDNDGYLDILITGSGSEYIAYIYHNNGDNTFTRQTGISLTGVYEGSVAWGDYDNDGYLDILLTGQYYTGTNYYVAKIYHNNSDNTFAEQTGVNLIGVFNSSATWGDYDNDGDLDILLTGNTGSATISKIYRNNTIMKAGNYQSNLKPAAPGNILATPQPDGVKLNWSPVNGDETPSGTMTYNIRIGSVSGSSNIYPSNSNNVSGNRRIPVMGNAQINNSFLIKNLPSGTYYWGVQAVDQGYQGGSWSTTGSFIVKNTQAFFDNSIVCLGLVTQFTDQSVAPDGISSWKWDFKDGTTSSEQDPSHIYKLSGTYKVKLVINSVDGDKDSLEQNVIILPKPTAGFNALTVCQGTQTTITNTTDYNGLTISSWHWDFGDGQTSIDQQPSPHGYLGAGNYTVMLKALADNDCIDSISKVVVVANYPVAAITANAPLTFCKGDSVALSVLKNNNYTYKWFIDGASITKGDSSKYIAKFSGNYKVEVVNKTGNCKTTSDQTVVTVHDAPVAPLILAGGPTQFCQGDSVVLSVANTTGYIYQWKLNGGAVGTNSYQYSAKSAGTYLLVISNSSGCSASSTNTINVVVNSKPSVPTVNVSGATSFCQGGSVDLNVTNNSAYNYQWKNNSTNISGANTYTYSVQNSGVYSLNITNSAGCSSKTDNVTVNISPSPTAPLISSGGSLQFCQGDSVNLSVTSTTGYTYQWKLNGGAVGSGSNQYAAKSAGAYSLVVSNSSGCSANSTNTVNVVVNSKPTLPIVNISGSTTFCQGGSVELSVTNNSSYTYQWENNGAGISLAVTSTYVAQNSGIYSLKISNSNGCVTKTENVTVNSLTAPSAQLISAGGALQFCQGDSVTLNATNTTGYTYQWKLNGGAVGSNSNQFVAKNAGSYNLVVSNTNSCSASSSNSVNVVVNSLPSVSAVSLSGPTTFCSGGTITLSVPSTSGYSYNWRNENGLISGAITYSYVANTSGKYQVDISNTSGCVVRTSQVNVVVKPMPIKPVITSDNYQAGKCMGEDPIRLNASQVVTGYNYQWYKNGIPINGAASSTYEAFLSQADYTLEADLGGCKSLSDVLNVHFENAPDKPFIYAEGPTVWYLACSNDSASQYKWYYNGTIIQGADKFIYVANRNLGQYAVSIANTKGCFTISDVITIPTGATGIKDIDPFAGLKIYPNPTPGLFTIEMDNQIFGELLINIIAQEGKEILKIKFEKTTVHFSSQIDLSGQAKGLYLINIRLDRYFNNNKIIIE